MKKLLLFLFLLPLIAQAQVNGTIQRTAATGIVRYFNSGAAGIDTLVNAGIGTNGFVPVYNSTLKKSVWTNPSTFGLNYWQRSGTTISPLTANDNLSVTSNQSTAIQAISTNSGGRALSLLANSTLEPLAVVQQGAGLIAAFTTTNGMTSTDKALIRNNGSIYTRGQLEVGNLLVGDAADSVMVHRAIDLTVRRVPTTGTGSAVFSASPTLTGEVTISSSTIPFKLNRTVAGGALFPLQIAGVDKSFIEWNINDNGTGVGTAMNLRNEQGAIGLYDDTDNGIKISGGNTTLSGTLLATKNQNATSTIGITNTDVTNGSSRAGLNATSGTVSGDILSINGDGSYVGTASNHTLYLMTNGSARITASTSGAIRYNNYGAGTLTTDASGNITATSDETWKEQFKPFTRGLKDLKPLKPVKYHWTKESGLDTENEYTYFKAQDVQKAIPEAVFPSKEGQPLGVQDRPIIATMINAINELNAKIEALELRIKTLENK
jgi:hypothetical protein